MEAGGGTMSYEAIIFAWWLGIGAIFATAAVRTMRFDDPMTAGVLWCMAVVCWPAFAVLGVVYWLGVLLIPRKQ